MNKWMIWGETPLFFGNTRFESETMGFWIRIHLNQKHFPKFDIIKNSFESEKLGSFKPYLSCHFLQIYPLGTSPFSQLWKGKIESSMFWEGRCWFLGHYSLMYSISHNHGSGTWLYLKGNYYWRDPFFTSMIMGGSVRFWGENRNKSHQVSKVKLKKLSWSRLVSSFLASKFANDFQVTLPPISSRSKSWSSKATCKPCCRMVGPTPWYDLLTKNHLERRCMDLYDVLLDNHQQKGLLLGRISTSWSCKYPVGGPTSHLF